MRAMEAIMVCVQKDVHDVFLSRSAADGVSPLAGCARMDQRPPQAVYSELMIVNYFKLVN
jgi:hypothetical protein